MRTAFCVVWMAGMAAAWPLGNEARAQFKDLAQHVPETANALVLVNAKAMFDSPIAQREDWRANREKQFAAGLTFVPPNATRLLIAAHMDIEVMHPTWEVAVAEREPQIPMESLAAQFGGTLDRINSLPAVRLPDDSYVVQFASGLLGMMSPGKRQQVSSWIDRSNRSPSPYLQEGIGYAEAGAELIMVLDLHNAFMAGDVQLVLDDYESVKNSNVNKAKLAELLASIKGVMLGVTFRDTTYGKLKVDFDQDAAVLADIAKPLILEIVGDYGVMIDELEGWTPEINGKTVTLGGPLDKPGLSRLASLIELPTTALHRHAADSANQPGPTNAADQAENSTPLEVTQKYFASVQLILDNLKAKKGDIKTMGQVAQWFESYGRKVDQLPTLNVDKEMLQYGSYISSQLHGGSMALKGNTIQRRVAEVNAADSSRIYGGAIGSVSSSYGTYGTYRATNAAYGLARRGGMGQALNSGLRQQQQAYTQVQTQSRAQGAMSIQQVVQNMGTATTQVRQAMTDKYQVQF